MEMSGENDYSYAYEKPSTGQANHNGGFEGDNGYKNSSGTTAVREQNYFTI